MADRPAVGLPETSWAIRRRVVFGTLAFCASGVTYLTIWGGPDSRLHETIASGLIALAGAVIGAYVFGAAYDDRNRIRSWATVQRSWRGTARVDDPDG